MTFADILVVRLCYRNHTKQTN